MRRGRGGGGEPSELAAAIPAEGGRRAAVVTLAAYVGGLAGDRGPHLPPHSPLALSASGPEEPASLGPLPPFLSLSTLLCPPHPGPGIRALSWAVAWTSLEAQSCF